MNVDSDPLDESSDVVASVAAIVASPLGIEHDATAVGDLEKLHRAIAGRVRQIIDYQFGRLAPMLYVLDIDEGRVREAFASIPSERLHDEIARMIVERSLQRVQSRRAYRNNQAGQGNALERG